MGFQIMDYVYICIYMNSFPISNGKVLVSLCPWFEAICAMQWEMGSWALTLSSFQASAYINCLLGIESFWRS